MDEVTFKDILKLALKLAGFECGHLFTMSKWITSGDNMGSFEITSIEDFKRNLGDGVYFLDLDNVTISGLAPTPFFVSYLCINLTRKGDTWEGNLYTEKEEMPHGYEEDLKKLDERRRLVNQKLLDAVCLITMLVQSRA